MSADQITTILPSSVPEDTLRESQEQQHTQYRLDMLPLVNRRFIETDVPAGIIQAARAHLLPKESIFALFQFASPYQFTTASGDIIPLPFWVMITGTRLLSLAVSEEGIAYQDIFDQHALVEYQSGIARDELRIAQKTVTTGMWEGRRKFYKEALALFGLPAYEKYLSLAQSALKEEQFVQAIPLLQASLQAEPTILGYLLLVHACSRQGDSDRALDVLQQACVFADPDAVLQELLRIFPDNLVLLLYLTIIYENNQWWQRGIALYQFLLQKTPDFDLYFLKLAEMYQYTGDDQAAIEHYQKFITLRTENSKSDDSSRLMQWNLDDLPCFSADPDLVKAYWALAQIHEEQLHDPPGALTLYLALIRQAPFYAPAYAPCWRMYRHVYAQQSVGQPLPFNINLFWQAYHLVDPQSWAALRLTETSDGPPEPTGYRPLDDHDHDQITHPGEREYLRRIQNWFINLVVKDDDAQGIEQYCEQVSHSNYPLLARTIQQVSQFLRIEMPRSFISRGKIGVSVKNREHPFIFIGSEHLTEGNDRYLAERELVFTIAAQAEHIKSGHLLMTETELWKNFGSVSFDGFLMALQCLPAGGFLSRLTHRFATEGLKKVYKMTKYARLQNIFRFLEKRGDERDADELLEDHVSSEDDLKNGRVSSKKSPDVELLLKDQIVDFARHAVYTADRVGLLACRDLESACSAIFKLASDEYDTFQKASHEGLAEVFKRRKRHQGIVYLEYAKRLSELLKFALSEDYQRLSEKTVS